ncbi:E3 ubiquitin-protein ligase TRIM36-like [Saccostrea cucullata]|uniref:E3 ubiquitin-protein ligase TRIM36-like n=1 Tax=Saccostrea cuccullata TaxID=36930 RepID=UPI002ED56358
MDQVPDTAQHFIECDTESCGNFSAFYCNTCNQRICCQCEQHHLDQNNGHEIVLFHEKKRKLPSEKCSIHPINDINVHCDVCQDPLCYMCFAQHHSDHDFSDFETIYNDLLQQCQKEVTHIWKREIPKARDNAALLEKKKENVKKEIAKFRVSMKEKADKLKGAIDSKLTDNNKKLNEIENSVISDTVEQLKETKEYMKYLEKLITDCESNLFSIKPTELTDFIRLKIFL